MNNGWHRVRRWLGPHIRNLLTVRVSLPGWHKVQFSRKFAKVTYPRGLLTVIQLIDAYGPEGSSLTLGLWKQSSTFVWRGLLIILSYGNLVGDYHINLWCPDGSLLIIGVRSTYVLQVKGKEKDVLESQ